MATRFERAKFALVLALAVGCGEPSRREVDNARAFEALLTAVSLRNAKELEADARLIDARRESGELSDGNYRDLAEVIAAGRRGDWPGAERLAYAFRARFGDAGAYFR